MGIRLKMLFRFLIARNHVQLQDVPMHVYADVCSQPDSHPLLDDAFIRSVPKCRRVRLQVLFRSVCFGLHVSHTGKNINPHSHTYSIATASAADVTGLLQVAL
jgi:hypothetical protein